MIIDFTKNYRIEAIPSKEHEELKKKGIGTYPGTTSIYSVKYDYVLKKYVGTGLDVNAPEILSLPEKERKTQKDWITKTKEELENQIGIPNYLDATKDNWTSELCTVAIEVGQDLVIRVNGHDNVLKPSLNHKDKIAVLILFNKEDFPKSKADIYKPEYRNARFYITTDEEVNTLTKASNQKRRRANVYMDELFSKDGSFEKVWNIAYYLKLVTTQKVSIDTLEETMEKAIFGDSEMLDKFIEACTMDPVRLNIFNMVRTAYVAGIIKISPDGYYHRGNTNYRKNMEDTVDYLLQPPMEQELLALKEDVEKRKKRVNAVG
jgi:hypothetical protein